MLRPKQDKRPRPEVKTRYFPFDGGLNLVDPPLDVKPGMLLGGQNYELRVRGGYRVIEGFERYDGMPSPSDSVYWYVAFDNGALEPTVGDIVGGQTSGALAHVLVVVLESGAWDGTGTGYMILHVNSGTFQDNDNIVEGHSAFSLGYDNGYE